MIIKKKNIETKRRFIQFNKKNILQLWNESTRRTEISTKLNNFNHNSFNKIDYQYIHYILSSESIIIKIILFY